MEETVPIFWVGLNTGCAAEMRVPLQDFQGWLASIWYYYYYCYWVLSGTGLVQHQTSGAVVPGMYGTHLKYGQCLQLISFN